MHFLGVNLWAVLVCGLATMAAGFLWYSPMLFAKPWTVLMGYDPNDKAKLAEMQKSAGPSYAMSFIASLLSAFVLGKLITVSGAGSAFDGLKIGLVVWLGFVSTVQLTNALFSRQPNKLYMINTGYQLVCYVVMGAILGAWR
jgi:surface polysaccharide O-acyltransferase-like enzyme